MPGAISFLWRLFIMVLTALPHLRWLQYLNIWKLKYFNIGISTTLRYFNIRMSIISKNCCPISASTPLSPVSGTPASISPMPSPLTRYVGAWHNWETSSAAEWISILRIFEILISPFPASRAPLRSPRKVPGSAPPSSRPCLLCQDRLTPGLQ